MYDNVENQLFFKCFQSHFLVILSPRDQESDRMSFWGKVFWKWIEVELEVLALLPCCALMQDLKSRTLT